MFLDQFERGQIHGLMRFEAVHGIASGFLGGEVDSLERVEFRKLALASKGVDSDFFDVLIVPGLLFFEFETGRAFLERSLAKLGTADLGTGDLFLVGTLAKLAFDGADPAPLEGNHWRVLEQQVELGPVAADGRDAEVAVVDAVLLLPEGLADVALGTAFSALWLALQRRSLRRMSLYFLQKQLGLVLRTLLLENTHFQAGALGACL